MSTVDPASGATQRRSRVLDPGCGFEALSRRLASQGWTVSAQAQGPLLPGEPEHASFAHADGGQLVYTFNPVCQLRVLDAPTALDADSLSQLPIVGDELVAAWLGSSDERTLLRGVLAARVLSLLALRPRLQALRTHASHAVQQAATAADAAMARQVEPLARQAAMVSIELIEEQLQPLLRALVSDSQGAVAATLRPRDDDFDKAFVPGVARAARQAYGALWSQPPRLGSASRESRIVLHLAPAGMLADDNELSRHLPGGYRHIASQLQPQRVWAAWKVIEPGQSAGTSYDGLVWLDDHWAWFPKPYRVLGPPGRDSQA
ncbi:MULTISPECIES: hypothetical protein [unclassified Rhizobacter]|uniref:hypothetical protein n=1 Tax=unclassified Rhizobacter TaxID=2640088 RepID=UPI0006F447AA|nr:MULTISPECIES: hypothetical protein [unclassified Rhizobacter]KQU77055.1 hypothetical protein ASC88_23340 [Rhizobacter sp. Root29]KQW14219.1 hypothetical protein ASC98_16380 [Rhizobacter sp. Root1238]KRB18585.1 hypothetical protein ASE08_04920 [Rhizobacter sp. Root16D2]